MAETTSDTPAELQPGRVIEFGDVTELRDFEDLIAPMVDPTYDADVWAVRPELKELLRPPKFNGRTTDIKLTVVEDAYARLLSARDRGWKFVGNSRNLSRTSELGQEQMSHTVGFIFTGTAHSRGRAIGTIRSEIYYAPVRIDKMTRPAGYKSPSMPRPLKTDSTSYAKRGYGEALKRYVTVPNIDPKTLEQDREISRQIGFKTLQHAMTHPIITPHRG